MFWLKSVLIFAVIALAEIGNGTLRMKFLNRPFGDQRARQLSVLSGSILISLISWFTVPWIGISTRGEALALGALWLVLMLAFDIGFGRWVFRAPWSRIFREFDLTQGGFLGFGMLVLLFAPWVVATLRGLL